MSGPLCLTRPSSVSQVRFRPSKSGVAALQRGHDAQRLGVVVEAAIAACSASSSARLAGMPERRVAEVVGQRQRLGEVLVEAERAGDASAQSGALPGCGSAGVR